VSLRVTDGASGAFIRLFGTREAARKRSGQRPPGVCQGTGFVRWERCGVRGRYLLARRVNTNFRLPRKYFVNSPQKMAIATFSWNARAYGFSGYHLQFR
jgi:hypothetical protein